MSGIISGYLYGVLNGGSASTSEMEIYRDGGMSVYHLQEMRVKELNEEF